MSIADDFVKLVKETTDFEKLKQDTLKAKNITFVGNAYRYVNHKEKLATTGFTIKKGLEKNRDIIRFDKGTLERMKDSYATLYNKKDIV